MTGMTIMTAV